MQISKLTPNPHNPRKITDAKLATLKKALLEFGDLSGIIYNQKTKHLVGGHQRSKHFDENSVIVYTKKYSKATKTGTVAEGYVELKGERFSYREVEWSEHREKAANIAANKGAGEWDMPRLGEWLKELSSFDLDFDLDLTMFDEEELKEFEGITVKEHTRVSATGVDEDDVPEKAPPRTKLGDIYRLGDHRLMCGDSTKLKQVERLMKGEKADLVFTDPPYNVDYSNAARPKASKTNLGKIKNDSMPVTEFTEFTEFLRKAYTAIFEATKKDAAIYVWYASVMTIPFFTAMEGSGLEASQQIIWKKPMLLGRGRYQWAHEPCIFAAKGSPYHTDDRTKTTVWDFGGYDKSKNVHPTQKPVILAEEAISNSSKENGNILDLFGGSGSTLIACEKTERKCFMMELDPAYCDVIVERWEKYTGKKAKLVSSAKDKPILKKAAPQPLRSHA